MKNNLKSTQIELESNLTLVEIESLQISLNEGFEAVLKLSESQQYVGYFQFKVIKNNTVVITGSLFDDAQVHKSYIPSMTAQILNVSFPNNNLRILSTSVKEVTIPTLIPVKN